MIGTPSGWGVEMSLGASSGSEVYNWMRWVLALKAPWTLSYNES